uniref:J domain-containing protein n=1 Tax=Chromera velia CCMP2878 TaxID=1169474 RepID=A0A0G4F1Q3_9ALVE|mmetsp:Transcript_24514/g.48062  ORF Transcript_24514/g.48062 Transcript_24514/m.48062 type:complete len:650 (+) Transcript_24514:178-2127(+)|eukprot:Cvel_2608.t1-p1 / transcript=Cvel_2608.t1 / gene=Cvel_2608 / organism=Chromera_velia_CCMP2878 / gene_product=DnaJ homolog subfamily C member 21, putative / transcript_product=DnaJ homolog subfamily C member 21, putative / location=Cvel_scaffold103:55149-61083(+) / protein_length=649 / sequence_SO=supercontig / SO=protein_coding / is_pseudo=false
MPAKTCFYEVLGVDSKADDNEIKKAYRKLALRWHPDKNPDNVKQAQEEFQKISEAYETLSDPQERAWYDSHKREILTGEDTNPEDAQETKLHLYKFFSREAFDDFGDGPRGFFRVFDELFKELFKEEIEECDPDEDVPPPAAEFGKSKTDWKDVNAFYMHWSNFATRKRMTQFDKYKPSDAPNRQIRRRIDEENANSRKEARQRLTRLVRELVAWVKKRDPRVIRRKAEVAEEQRKAKEEAQRKKEEAEKKKRLERKQAREEEERKWKEYKAAKEAAEAAGEEFAASDYSSFEEEEVALLRCQACNKNFKSEKQLEAHTKSKKHVQAVKALRRKLEKEERELQKEKELQAEEEEESGDGEELSEEEEEVNGSVQRKNEEEGTTNGVAEEDEVGRETGTEEDEEEQEEEDSPVARPNAVAENGVSENEKTAEEEEEDEKEEEEDDIPVSFLRGNSRRDRKQQQKRARKGKGVIRGPISSSDEEEEADAEEDDEGVDAPSPSAAAAADALFEENAAKEVDWSDDDKKKKKGKGAKGRAKGKQPVAAAAAASAENAEEVSENISPAAGEDPFEEEDQQHGGKQKGKGKKGGGSAPSAGGSAATSSHSCSVCGAAFDSRTKLFTHIREKGHAALKTVQGGGSGSGGKKGKNKK